MRYCCLGSGSEGNAHIVEHGDVTLLIDCGFSLRELTRRLASRNINWSEITAIFVSDEHSDHIAALPLAIKKHARPFYMSLGTLRAVAPKLKGGEPAAILRNGDVVRFGGLSVSCVAAPHDVAEPLRFVVEDGTRRLALFTDLGHVTPAIKKWCDEADLLVIECDYDETLLAANDKLPQFVVDRIKGGWGHLSNANAAALLAQTQNGARRQVVAAHLSYSKKREAANNRNRPDLAYAALAAADARAQITIASQDEAGDWLTV